MSMRSRALFTLIAVIIGSIAGNALAAAAQRTFVASNGNDANPCSLLAPCRSFNAAITNTLPAAKS